MSLPKPGKHHYLFFDSHHFRDKDHAHETHRRHDRDKGHGYNDNSSNLSVNRSMDRNMDRNVD